MPRKGRCASEGEKARASLVPGHPVRRLSPPSFLPQPPTRKNERTVGRPQPPAREETAAARSQANTACLLADNPVLMRLRELETLERIAERGELWIFVGDGETVGKKVFDLV